MLIAAEALFPHSVHVRKTEKGKREQKKKEKKRNARKSLKMKKRNTGLLFHLEPQRYYGPRCLPYNFALIFSDAKHANKKCTIMFYRKYHYAMSVLIFTTEGIPKDVCCEQKLELKLMVL